MCTRAQHNHQSSGRIQSLPICSEKAGQGGWHTEEVPCTTLEHGWTIKRTDLAQPLHCWRIAGWWAATSPLSQHHTWNKGKNPTKPPFSSQISPALNRLESMSLHPSYPACSRLLGRDGNEEHCCVSLRCNQPVHGARTTFQLYQEESSRIPGSWGSQGF